MLLCFPSVGRKPGNKGYVKSWMMEPVGLAVIAGLTPDNFEITFVDDRFEDMPFDLDFDVVALSVETYTANRAYQITKLFQSRGIPVIMGGYHPTLVPDEAETIADAIVVGQAEGIWGKVCADIENGTLCKRYEGKQDIPLKGGIADRSIYAGKKYSKVTLIETARGCCFNCGFCSIAAFSKGCYKTKPIEDVINEVSSSKYKNFFFVDDNIVVDKKRALTLFSAIKPLRIAWVGQVSVNSLTDENLVREMKASGCLGVLIGFESFDNETLKKMNKSSNKSTALYDEALSVLSKFGVGVYGTFVFGYENDTELSFELAYQFAVKKGLYFAAFNHLVPFPGTALYKELEEDNSLCYNKWWLDPNYKFGDVAFNPKSMSAQKLKELCYYYRFKFGHPLSILKRMKNIKANIGSLKSAIVFLSTNVFSNRETRSREGLPMGFPERNQN